MATDSKDDDATIIVDRSNDGELRPGDILRGRFVIERLLGEGGQGQVFLALDREAEATVPYVAIKILSKSFKEHPESLKALRREATQSRQLNHPNIVNVYDFDRDSEHVFMVMEYMRGNSLDVHIQQNPKGAALGEVWDIVKACSDGLGYLHEKNVIHADFKPGNVFVTDKGEIKVLDLGIARIAEKTFVGEGTVPFNPDTLGALTPQYASCEMFAGLTPIAQDDLFALGCVTYELLTGRHPYARKTAMQARAEKLEPVRPQGLKTRQWRALNAALAHDRENRPECAEDFLAGMNPEAASGGSTLPWIVMTAVMVVVVGLVMFVNQTSTDEEFLDDMRKRYARNPDFPRDAEGVAGWMKHADMSVEMGVSAFESDSLDRAIAHLRTGSSSAYQSYGLALSRSESAQVKERAAEGHLGISKAFKEAAFSESDYSVEEKIMLACHGLSINRYDTDLMSFVISKNETISGGIALISPCTLLLNTGIISLE